MVVLLAVALAVAASAFANAQPKHVVVASNRCRGHVYRPSRITLECSKVLLNSQFHDGRVADLKYSSYGGGTARATGLFYEPGFGGSPPIDGVAGHITLKNVMRCDGRWYYGTISWHFSKLQPASGGVQTTTGGAGTSDIGPSPHCPHYYGD